MSDWPFVARANDVDRLRAHLETDPSATDPSATDGAAAVVVRGPAGIGKSALVGHVVASYPGVTVKVRAESTIAPFDGIGLLRPDVLDVGSLDPAGFVQAVIDRWADGAPDVVWVDDVGHLDDRSATVLFHVARRRWSRLVLTERTGAPPSPLLAQLDGVGLLDTIDLDPFDRRGCGQLLTARLGGPVAPATVELVASRSRGNPLVIRELVRAGLADGSLRRQDDGWCWVGHDTVAESVATLTASHMATLSSSALGVVDMLTIAGDLAVDELDGDLAAAAIELVDSEVGAVEAGRLVIAHPLFAEAARVGFDDERRRRALEALVRRGPRSTPGVMQRLRVLRWRRELGEDIEGSELVEGTNLAMSVFDTLTAADLGEAAVAVGESAAALPLALALTYAGRLEEASTAAKVAAAGAIDEATLTFASIAGTLARAYRFGFDSSVVADHRGLAARLVDPSLRAFVDSELCSALAFSGELDAAVALGAEHVAAGEWWQRLPFVPGWAGAATALGRTDDVLATLDRAVAVAGEEAGRAVAWLHAFRASAALLHGDLGLAERAITRFDELAYLAMVPGVAAVLRSETRGIAAMWRGDVDVAVELLREAVARSDVPESDFRRVVPCSFLAMALALTGDADGADAAAADATEAAARFPLGAPWAPLATAWARAARGDRTGAGRVALGGAHAALDAGHASAALWCAFDAWSFAPTPSAARAVVDVAARVDGAWGEAFALAARGHLDRDDHAFDDAAQQLGRLGAALHVDRLADVRRSLDTAAQFSSAVGSLTRRETEVAALAADGRPNREIAEVLGISVRTAETHLHRAMGKLGAATRDDLLVYAEDLRRRP